jgi:hypothetical protein
MQLHPADLINFDAGAAEGQRRTHRRIQKDSFGIWGNAHSSR